MTKIFNHKFNPIWGKKLVPHSHIRTRRWCCSWRWRGWWRSCRPWWSWPPPPPGCRSGSRQAERKLDTERLRRSSVNNQAPLWELLGQAGGRQLHWIYRLGESWLVTGIMAIAAAARFPRVLATSKGSKLARRKATYITKRAVSWTRPCGLEVRGIKTCSWQTLWERYNIGAITCVCERCTRSWINYMSIRSGQI